MSFVRLHVPPLRQVFSLAWSSQTQLEWLVSESLAFSCVCLSGSGIANAQWHAEYLYLDSEDHIQGPRLAVPHQMCCLPRTHWLAFYVENQGWNNISQNKSHQSSREVIQVWTINVGRSNDGVGVGSGGGGKVTTSLATRRKENLKAVSIYLYERHEFVFHQKEHCLNNLW